MREIIDHYLVVAMAIAEVFRGIREVRDHLGRQERACDTPEAKTIAGRILRRHRQRVAFAFVGGLALIPTLYYGGHALPLVATTIFSN